MVGGGLGLFLLRIAIVLRFVSFSFDPAITGIGGTLISYSVEHLGEFKYPSILLKIHPFPQPMGI